VKKNRKGGASVAPMGERSIREKKWPVGRLREKRRDGEKSEGKRNSATTWGWKRVTMAQNTRINTPKMGAVRAGFEKKKRHSQTNNSAAGSKNVREPLQRLKKKKRAVRIRNTHPQ